MTPARPLVITLVDDNELSVAGLQALLAPHAERIRVVSTREALASPTELDVVLHEPLGCSEFSTRLKADLLAASQAHLVVFTWAPAEELDPGSRPVLPKSMTASQVVRALEDVVQGRVVATPARPSTAAARPQHASVRKDARGATATVAGHVASTATAKEARAGKGVDRHALTSRELEVLTGVTRGLTNHEIGIELALSINSIKTYIRSAYRKIGVTRRTQAVAWGLAHGLAAGSATRRSAPV